MSSCYSYDRNADLGIPSEHEIAISFTSDNGMMLVAEDRRSSSSPCWMPVRVALATIYPLMHGLLLSNVLETVNGAVVSPQVTSKFTLVIETDTVVVADEVLYCFKFTDISITRSWPEFQLRFKGSSDYWDFAEALARAKRDALRRRAGIDGAFEALSLMLPGQAEAQVQDDDVTQYEITLQE
ncbi:hypothetical protein FKP32DRAFT_1607217 [Trametes sanguinea]|nr:hypothetical protein FKP32DRAFT_1607217 [Trametes sanguinea]